MHACIRSAACMQYMVAGVGCEAMEAGSVDAGEEGASDLRVKGHAALQSARAGQPQERRRCTQEVRRRRRSQIHHRHQQIVDYISIIS